MIPALPDPGVTILPTISALPALPPDNGGSTVAFAQVLGALPDAAPAVAAPPAMQPPPAVVSAPTLALPIPLPGGTILPLQGSDLPPAALPAPQRAAVPAEPQPLASTDAQPSSTQAPDDEISPPDELPPAETDEDAPDPEPAAQPIAAPVLVAALLPATPPPLPAPVPTPSAPRTAVTARLAVAASAPLADQAQGAATTSVAAVPDGAAPVPDTSAPAPHPGEVRAPLTEQAASLAAPPPPAAPTATPPPATPSPALAATAEPRSMSGQESAIAQVGEIREALRAARPEVTMRHAEFGFVNLRIEPGAAEGWRAVLASRDPGFVPAVQAALAERAIAAAAEPAPAHSGSHQGSASDQRYGSSHSPGQGSSSPYMEQFPKRDEGGERQQQRQRSPQGDERRGDDGEQVPGQTRRGMFA